MVVKQTYVFHPAKFGNLLLPYAIIMHFLTKTNILLQNLVTFWSQIFFFLICDQKVTKFCSKKEFCQKMHFYGITAVIILKFCKVMKS